MNQPLTVVAQAVADKFKETEITNSVEAPIEIIVVGVNHSGKSHITALIEDALMTAGFTSVTVTDPETTARQRDDMLNSLALSVQPNQSDFLGKAIAIHDATVFTKRPEVAG